MNDKPRFLEYILRSRSIGNVVKTSDGRFFVIANTKTFIKVFRFLFILETALIGLSLQLPGFFNLWPNLGFDLWPNLGFEFYILAEVIFLATQWLQHHLTFYEPIAPGSEDYREVTEWFQPKIRKIRRSTSGASGRVFGIIQRFFNILAALFLIFALLNSHTSQLVRSLFDSQPLIASVEITHPSGENRNVLYSDDDNDLPDTIALTSGDDLFFEVIVSRTLSPAKMQLNGTPLPNEWWLGTNKRSSFFWEEDYLKQIYIYSLSNIHDGSVLTLTCGPLTREWVFDVADKEAA